MQSLSQVGLTGRGGKEGRKAEPEICEWCGTYRVVFLSKPTSNVLCFGDGRRVVWHRGPNLETTLTKTLPVFTITGEDRQIGAGTAAGCLVTGEGEEWNVEGRRRRAAQKYLRDSPTDHRSHGSDTAAVTAPPRASS